MKKLFSVLLVLLMFFVLYVSAFSAGTTDDIPDFFEDVGAYNVLNYPQYNNSNYTDYTADLVACDGLLTDAGDLLTDAEEKEVLSALTEVSEKNNMNIAVVTVNSLGYRSAMEYADDFYDTNFGINTDGVLLLICYRENNAGNNDWYVSTTGKGIDAFTDSDVSSLGNNLSYDLSNGNFASAFTEYASICNREIATIGKLSPIWIVIALVAGLILAAIVTGSMKGKLKSVTSQNVAREYVRAGSVKITRSSEHFLYHTLNRVPIPKTTSSSGGHSSHTGHSGGSHGGGGGKF